MGISDGENIDKLFKRLGDHVIEPDTSQVDEMRIRLEQKRFYRFGWKHFNVYHTVVIGISAILSLGLVADRFVQHNTENGNTAIVDTIYITDTVLVSTKIGEDALSQDRNSEAIAPAKKYKLLPQIDTLGHAAQNDQDSISVSTYGKHGEALSIAALPKKEKPDSIKLQKTVPPKRVIYITKRDTVFKYDTTKVVKKK